MKKVITLLFLLFTQSGYSQNTEVKILDALNSPHSSNFSDSFFKYASHSSYPVSLTVPATMFTVSLFKKDKMLRWKSYQMAAGFGLSMSMSLLLKYSPSFPSGNTTGAFETAMSLSLNFPKWYVIVPAYAWAGSIAYGRMHLGMHYPGDVAVGMLIGTGSAWLTWKINERIFRKRAERMIKNN
jgi:undecaprenyl-diphosphatase